MDLHVDLGQVIIGSLIAGVGYLMKMEIANFSKRLDKHEDIIVSLVGDVQRLIGINIGAASAAVERHDRQDAAERARQR